MRMMVKKRYVTVGAILVATTIAFLSSYYSDTGSSSETRFVVSLSPPTAVQSGSLALTDAEESPLDHRALALESARKMGDGQPYGVREMARKISATVDDAYKKMLDTGVAEAARHRMAQAHTTLGEMSQMSAAKAAEAASHRMAQAHEKLGEMSQTAADATRQRMAQAHETISKMSLKSATEAAAASYEGASNHMEQAHANLREMSNRTFRISDMVAQMSQSTTDSANHLGAHMEGVNQAQGAEFAWGEHGPSYSLEQRVAHVGSMVMHEPGPAGPNVVMALMTNTGTDIMKYFVGSLRKTGYPGRIILGVEDDLNQEGLHYLMSQNVTLIGIRSVPCIAMLQAIKNQSEQQNVELSSCGEGYEDLYLEESRYAMALDWLEWCGPSCTGWAIVSDSSDTYFQGDPFKEMNTVVGSAAEADQAKNFFVIGEWSLIVDHWFIKAPVERCYDLELIQWSSWKHRPMLCSGTSVGTIQGMTDYLRVITREFRRNVQAGWGCLQPPYTDQAIHDMLFYTGRLGPKASVFEWGQGPILTIGEPCEHGDPTTHSLLDVVSPDQDKNVNRPDGTLAPMLHQWDRCWDWILPILAERFSN